MRHKLWNRKTGSGNLSCNLAFRDGIRSQFYIIQWTLTHSSCLMNKGILTGHVFNPGLWFAHEHKWEVWQDAAGQWFQQQLGREGRWRTVTKPLYHTIHPLQSLPHVGDSIKSTAPCGDNGQVKKRGRYIKRRKCVVVFFSSWTKSLSIKFKLPLCFEWNVCDVCN
jgi:hypothetical protein